MRVTILTPTLDAERYLHECLASVRAQTYPRDRIQHLVLDGGSRDRTVALAREAGAEVTVERDGSLYEAMNRGVRLAGGEVIGWLNADDVLAPDAVRAVVAALDRAPGAGLAVGDTEIAEGGRVRLVRARADALRRLREGRRTGAWVTPLSVFFRAGTLRSLGEYRTRYRICADLELWMRAAARDPLPDAVHAGAVLGRFRVHEGSLSSGRRMEASARETAAMAWEWYQDASAPEGVRRFALYVYRRHTYLARVWAAASGPAARLAARVSCYRELRKLGAGTLADMRTGLA